MSPLISFPKLELPMRLHLLRQLAIIATLILLLAPVPPLRLSARADDAPKTAHEAAVLDRIFANWKARHDRVHSLHMTWDRRVTSTRGKDAFEQFGLQVFFDGDQRYCTVDTLIFNVPRVKRTDTRLVVERCVIDGDTTWEYFAGPRSEQDLGDPNARKAHGVVSRTIPPNPTLSAIQAFWLAFRPEFPELSWRRDQCRLVDEHATIDGVQCVKIQRVIEPPANGLREKRRFESLWVSPVRDDVVVHWTVEAPTLLMEGAIRYIKDRKVGWVPSEWTWEIPVIHNLEECRVTGYTINEKIDPSVFSHEFPPGTPVQDARGRDKPEGLRHYVVERDGSKRAISLEDFLRISNAH
jgi:hypothetical protein